MTPSTSRLPTILGPRELTAVAVAPGQVRIDMQCDEDEHDRACVIRDAAWVKRVIADLERALSEALRMEP